MPSTPVPALFIGHGSPMNAVEDNATSRGWRRIAGELPRPAGVICVSAHWETGPVAVTAMDQPRTIHDFSGFPKALFDARYPAPGSPALAQRIARLLAPEPVALDQDWGLDHGAWSVLASMYPAADVPVVQVSLARRTAAEHYALACRLAPLRDEGILILGSGNIVHNLRLFGLRDPRIHAAWVRFNDEVKRNILAGHHKELIAYESLTPEALLSVPTPEHYLPLLYALAVQRAGEPVSFFGDDDPSTQFMTSVRIG